MAAVIPLDERDRHIPGIKDVPEEPMGEAPEMDVEERPDGTAVVREFPKMKGAQKPVEHLANLASVIDEADLQSLSDILMDRIEEDKQARRKRDEQYQMGLRRTGLGDDAPGGATFAGASRAVHPMLAEACVDFSASAIRELFPPSGPVKTQISSTTTKEKLAVADRQAKLLNWQLTEQISEYVDELEQTTTQLPMGGSQYMKFWRDDTLGRTTCEFAPIDDVLLPYGCSDFWSAHRITHVQRLTENTYADRVENGLYIDTGMEPPGQVPEQTKAAEANMKIEGVEQPMRNIDGLRIVYEVNTFAKLKIDGDKRLPYLISIDERVGKVCAVYRNWEEQDKYRKRLHWMADFGFIPWRGAYKIGLPHLIGGLSAAATGALRALLDGALVSTLPVLIKLKGSKFSGQSKTIDPTQAIELEGGANMDDIRKLAMPVPFPGPSPTLFQLLGWLTQAGKGVVTTAEEKVAEANANMPVGTTLALIEQGAKIFASIHARLHRSQKRALQIIARLNKNHLTDEEQMEALGEVLATRADFAQPLGVIPVSDPNIFSEGQRYAQTQAMMQLSADQRVKYNVYELHKRALKQMKVPDIDEVLPPPDGPKKQNAAAENAAMMMGQPAIAFPEQDHWAHLETHVRFAIDPLTGANPAAVAKGWPSMVEHLKQHISFLYVHTMFELCSTEMGADVSTFMRDPGNEQKIDQLLAAASKHVHVELAEKLGTLGPVMNGMLQQVVKMQPTPPQDPSAAAVSVAKMDDARKREETAAKDALNAAEIQRKTAKDEDDAGNKERDLDIKEFQVVAGMHTDASSVASAEETAMREHQLEAGSQDLARQQHEHGAALDVANLHKDTADQQHRHGLEVARHGHEVQKTAHDQDMGRAQFEHSVDQDNKPQPKGGEKK